MSCSTIAVLALRLTRLLLSTLSYQPNKAIMMLGNCCCRSAALRHLPGSPKLTVLVSSPLRTRCVTEPEEIVQVLHRPFLII
ncbi:hypothetical protein IW261DRAFT_1481196, partial [Armillaria novae-zelandiae]